MNPARLRLEWAMLLLTAILGCAALQSGGATQRIDNQMLDRAMALARPSIPDGITLVTIDDRSLAELGAWPWPRETHARLIDRLAQARARAVVLDVLFIEPGEDADDEALTQAMERSGLVFLPHAFTRAMNVTEGNDPLLPLPRLAQAARGVGHVAVEPDADGVLRRFDLIRQTGQRAYPHLALRVLNALDEVPARVRDRQSALVPFQPTGGIPAFSAADVLAGAAPSEFLEGQIVLIGATAPGLGDRYSVSAGEVDVMSGVEIQANLLSALMAGAIIDEAPILWQQLIGSFLLIALFIVFWVFPPRFSLITAFGIIVCLFFASLAALAIGYVWFPPATIMLVVLLSYPLWSWRRLGHVSRYLDNEAARLVGSGQETGELTGLDYVTRQIERLKALVGAVHGSATFLERLIEAVPDAIIVLDGDQRVAMLNAAAKAILPQAEKTNGQSLEELWASNGAIYSQTPGEVVLRDERVFLIARAQMDATPTAQGRGSGEILALRDITDRRRLDEERRQMLEFLSHDMRSPQVAIIGLARNAAQEEKGAAPLMERIRTQAERTLKLADDFVQLARLESLGIQKEDSDLGALVDEACDRAWGLARSKRMQIAQSLPEDPCFADVDASLIARMLDNLIGNAVKYAPEGSQIDVALVCEADGAHRIVVSDQGPGLSGSRREDPFARFGAHASNAGPSAGLGLALVKKVVDAHHGEIAVAQPDGGGTRFTIRLPASDDEGG